MSRTASITRCVCGDTHGDVSTATSKGDGETSGTVGGKFKGSSMPR